MRYPVDGRLTAEGRARREKVRLQAARMFEQDMDPVQVTRTTPPRPADSRGLTAHTRAA